MAQFIQVFPFNWAVQILVKQPTRYNVSGLVILLKRLETVEPACTRGDPSRPAPGRRCGGQFV